MTRVAVSGHFGLDRRRHIVDRARSSRDGRRGRAAADTRRSRAGDARRGVNEYSIEPCTRPAITARTPALQPRGVDVADVADEIVSDGRRRCPAVDAEQRDELVVDVLPERAHRDGRRREVALDADLDVVVRSASNGRPARATRTCAAAAARCRRHRRRQELLGARRQRALRQHRADAEVCGRRVSVSADARADQAARRRGSRNARSGRRRSAVSVGDSAKLSKP